MIKEEIFINHVEELLEKLIDSICVEIPKIQDNQEQIILLALEALIATFMIESAIKPYEEKVDFFANNVKNILLDLEKEEEEIKGEKESD